MSGSTDPPARDGPSPVPVVDWPADQPDLVRPSIDAKVVHDDPSGMLSVEGGSVTSPFSALARVVPVPVTPLMQPTARHLFLAFVGILVGVGVLMAFSASMSSRPGVSSVEYIVRHLACLALAFPAAAIASRVTPEGWRRLAPWAFLGVCALLVLVLIPGIGSRVNGARRWFRIAGLSLQPSELMKIALPPYLAVVLEQQRALKRPFLSDVARLLVPLGVAAVLCILEPDLGSAVLLLTTGGIVLWVGGWSLRRMALAAFLCSPSLLGLFFLKPYQRQRLTGFVDVWTAPEQAPYQIKQSLLTLGVGGWFGEGLGKGWQKLSFLPEANTDFVFSVVGEELGLVGTIGVVGAWLGVYLTGLRLLSAKHPRSLSSIIGFTWLTMLVAQAALNICVVTALAPPKGVSHPLLSYGGTSLLVSIVIVGAFLGVTRENTALPAVVDSPKTAGGIAGPCADAA